MSPAHKPLIFYSHDSDDKQVHEGLRSLLDVIFQEYFAAFDSSDTLSITAGAKWREEIRKNLEEAFCVLVILTPRSIKNNWVMYEAGACWFATETKNKILIPCTYRVETAIPDIFSITQQVNLLQELDLRRLIETLKTYIPFKIKDETIEQNLNAYLAQQSNLAYDFADLGGAGSQMDEACKGMLSRLAQYYKNEKHAGKEVAEYMKKHKAISQGHYSYFLDELRSNSSS
jgi:hypothetical protein